MSESTIKLTIVGFIDKLSEAIKTRDEAGKRIGEYAAAIRALAKVMEDKEAADACLATLEELSGKPGFVSTIRSVLRSNPNGLTPTEIKGWIQFRKSMDLSVYSNPMASIHTTIRRMVDSGEVEPIQNVEGEKAYRFKAVSSRITPTPHPPRTLRRKL